MRRPLSATLALLLLTTPSPARQADFSDDLRFAEALRARGDSDLALEFLRKLAPAATPALARELPLEFAKTRLRLASEEPDTGKRLALYKEARDDFEQFIRANPGHPRLAEANLDIARIFNLQGKTELSRAFLAEDGRAKREQAARARATLESAARQLQAAEDELTKARDKLPDPDALEDPKLKKEARAARLRADAEVKQTQLDRALNLYDQAGTYLEGTGDEAASRLLEQARKLLNPLAAGDANDPIRWKARAWQGRITFETDTADKARAIFLEVLNATAPAAAEGQRLARYFRLLVIKKQPSESDMARGGPNAVIIEAGTRWRNDYRRFWRTPEGVGLTFLLAEALLAEADANKKLAPPVAGRYRFDARALLREVEGSENEFTERARRMKINAMVKQGLLKGDVKLLANFEECFVRAQYEAMQMAQEQKETRDPAEAEKKRKARIDTIVAALERGLSLPDAKKLKASTELNTARSMLAYWALNTGKLAEAIAAGEGFAREDPRSGQAEMSAVYALQAYSQLVGQKQGKFEDTAGDRARMFALASYMEQRWPGSIGGDVARHSVGLQLLREENFPEAIKKLALVGPGYANYALVCYQLADACNKAEKASVEPIPGDRPGDYAKRKLLALERMSPEALGPDPLTNQLYVSGKAMLGRDLFRLRRYQEMDDLATGLLGRLLGLRFNDDEDKDRAIRNQLRYELVDIRLYARYGLADAAYAAGDSAKVVALLDPLVDAVTKSDDGQEKANLQKNQQLASALLILALRANIALGKIDRTDLVLDVLDKVSGESGSATNVLRLMAFLIRGQIEELRKKGDKDALAAATKGYGAILDKRIRKQKDLTPEFIRVLADCYASMDEHARAAEELAKVAEPKGARPGSDEEKLYRRVQLDLIRELRLTRDVDNLKKAREMMAGILGEPKKPGWGRRDLLALKEQGSLLEAEERHKEAFEQWSDLTRRLARDAPKGGAVKEHYLECYYHMIVNYLKMGLAKPAQQERDKYLKTAALQIAGLEKAWEDFGSEASKRRFTELLAQEPALREQYEAVRKKK